MSDLTFLYAYALRSQAPKDPAAFRRLAHLKGPLGPLSAAIFLLYSPVEADGIGVWSFLDVTLPRLLPQLTRSTRIERVELNAQVRGRVDWPATHKQRASADSNPAVYVCRQSHRRFDQPENELLKFLLAQVQACLECIPAGLGDWDAWGVAEQAQQRGRQRAGIDEQARRIGARLRSYRTNVYLREVRLPKAVGSLHLSAARTSKNELYGEVADLYELYRQVVEADSWPRWAEALQRSSPLPPELSPAARAVLLD